MGETLLRVGWGEVIVAALASAAAGVLFGSILDAARGGGRLGPSVLAGLKRSGPVLARGAAVAVAVLVALAADAFLVIAALVAGIDGLDGESNSDGLLLVAVVVAVVVNLLAAVAVVRPVIRRGGQVRPGPRSTTGRVGLAAVTVAGTGLYAIVVGAVPTWVAEPDECDGGRLSVAGGAPVFGRPVASVPPGDAEEVAAATGASPPMRLLGLEADGTVGPTLDGGLELRIDAGSHRSVADLKAAAEAMVHAVGAEVVGSSSSSGSLGEQFRLEWQSEQGEGSISATSCGLGLRTPARFASTSKVGPARLGDCAGAGRLAVCEAIYDAADVVVPSGISVPTPVAPAVGPIVEGSLASVGVTDDGRLVLDQPPVTRSGGAVAAFGAASRVRNDLSELGWTPDPSGIDTFMLDVHGTPLRLTFAIDDFGTLTLRIETLVPVPA